MSLTTCLITALTIIFNKEFKDAHPNYLIAMICLGEFMTCWMVLLYQHDPVSLICDYDMDTLLYNTLTLWGSINKDMTKKIATKTLTYCVIILFDFF